MGELAQLASTFRAVDIKFNPEDYQRDFERFDKVLLYVDDKPASVEAEGRLVAFDEEGEGIKDVWGLFVSTVLFLRESQRFDRNVMYRHYRDLLKMIPAPKTDEERDDARKQATKWNDWTRQLKKELEERTRSPPAGLHFLKDDLSDIAGKDPTTPKPTPPPPSPKPSTPPGSPGTTTPTEPEEDPIDAAIRRNLAMWERYVDAARVIQAFFAGDGEDLRPTLEAKVMLKAFDRADKLPKERPGATRLDRLGQIAAHLTTSIAQVSQAIQAFKLANYDDNSVVEFARVLNKTLGD